MVPYLKREGFCRESTKSWGRRISLFKHPSNVEKRRKSAKVQLLIELANDSFGVSFECVENRKRWTTTSYKWDEMRQIHLQYKVNDKSVLAHESCDSFIESLDC